MIDDADSLTLELLPADDQAVNEQDDLDAAVASVLDPELGSITPDTPKAFGRTWAYDFVNGRFVRFGDSPAEVTGEAALIVWVEAAMRTARYAYPVFSDAFGTEFPDDLIGRTNPSVAFDLYKQHVRDALLVHDRIAEVKDFEGTFDTTTGIFNFSFEIVTDEGESIQLPNNEVRANA